MELEWGTFALKGSGFEHILIHHGCFPLAVHANVSLVHMGGVGDCQELHIVVRVDHRLCYHRLKVLVPLLGFFESEAKRLGEVHWDKL